MLGIIKKINSDKKQIRNFAIIFSLIFFAISGFLFWKQSNDYYIFVIIAIFFFLSALFAPKILKPIYILWMLFGEILGWFMTRVIVSFVFFFILFPIGFFARLFGRKFLIFKSNNKTYWNFRSNQYKSNNDYEKQF